MRIHNPDFPSSQSDSSRENEQPNTNLSRFAIHEKCDNFQQDEQSYSECKKLVNTTVRTSPRLARKSKTTHQHGDRPAKLIESVENLNQRARPSFQRLDALTLFESQSHSAFREDPDQALYFTKESISKAGAALWKEIQSSNAFVRYCENKIKPKAKKGKSIWTNELERIFCDALVRWPPMGRTKIFYNGKRRGKNELIIEYIYEQTGILLSYRKTISSHIQNIRPFFLDKPKVLPYLPVAKDAENGKASRKSKRTQVRRARRLSSSSMTSTAEVIPRGSIKEDFAPVDLQLRSRCLIPCYFEMFVTDPRLGMPAYLHVFTKSDKSSWLSEVRLQDVEAKRTLLTSMSAILNSGLSLCQTIICEASLDIFRDPLPNGADLGIQFEFKSDQDLEGYNFECFTSIFDGEERVDSSSGRVGYDAEGSKRLHKIPFGSNFWAHKMGGFTKSIREIERKRALASSDGVEDLNQLKQDVEDHIAESINSLSATQEIFAVSKIDNHPERVLLVHWTFTYAQPSADAKTTWRPLNISQPEDFASIFQEEDCLLQGSQGVNHYLSKILPQVENSSGTSSYDHVSSNEASSSHLSSYGLFQEYAAPNIDLSAAHAATDAVQQMNFAGVAIPAVATSAVSNSEGISGQRASKSLGFSGNHQSYGVGNDHNNDEFNAVETVEEIDAGEASLNIQVGLSQDIYELSQRAPFEPHGFVPSFVPHNLVQGTPEGLSQDSPQEDQVFHGQAQGDPSQHSYSHPDLFQQVPEALGLDTTTAESQFNIPNCQPDDLAFAPNSVRPDFPARHLYHDIHQQDHVSASAANTMAYLYEDRQSQLCSYG